MATSARPEIRAVASFRKAWLRSSPPARRRRSANSSNAAAPASAEALVASTMSVTTFSPSSVASPSPRPQATEVAM
jgi:hypothetical protein